MFSLFRFLCCNFRSYWSPHFSRETCWYKTLGESELFQGYDIILGWIIYRAFIPESQIGGPLYILPSLFFYRPCSLPFPFPTFSSRFFFVSRHLKKIPNLSVSVFLAWRGLPRIRSVSPCGLVFRNKFKTLGSDKECNTSTFDRYFATVDGIQGGFGWLVCKSCGIWIYRVWKAWPESKVKSSQMLIWLLALCLISIQLSPL